MSPQILFADSDALLCVTARRALQERGFAVTIAHDGSEVFERFDQHAYAAVVLGWSLRLVDGPRVLREIKQREADLPIILLATPQAQISATERANTFAILNTPITDWDTFAETLRQAIQSRPPKPLSSDPVAHMILDHQLLEQLHALAILTQTDKPLEEMLDGMLRAVAQLLKTNHVALILIEGDYLRLYHAFDTPGSSADGMQFDEAWVLRVASEQRTLIEPLAMSTQARILGAPLIVRNRVLGVLIAYPLPSESLTPAQRHWLELFGTYGGLAIELERLQSEATQQPITDPVTTLLRRAPFLELADREFRRAWRYNQPITAILISLDNLTDIQTTSGSFIAERVLKLAAQWCRSTVRSVDLVCRYTDDTFAVLLLMTTNTGTHQVAERLRDGIAGLDLPSGKGPLRLTTSLGVCAYPRDGCSSIFDMLAIAHEAQHAARRAGTNQIVYV